MPHRARRLQLPAPSARTVLPIADRLGTDPALAGRGAVVAFLDSGFYAHPDLCAPAPRIVAYHDVLSGRSDPEAITRPDASSWHGMMTTVVAAGNGALSGGRWRGLAHEARLVLVKVGHMTRVQHDDLARGIEWIVEQKDRLGIRVVNVSCGGDYVASYLHDRLSRAAEDAVRAGLVVVCAVGNAGNDPGHPVLPPASAPAPITVGGLDDDGDPRRGRLGAYRSSYGPTVDGLQKPEVIAPAIWVAAPILPGTPTAAEAALLERLDAAPDEELARVIAESPGVMPDLDAAAGMQPYLFRQIVRMQLHDKQVLSGHYKHVDGTSFAAPIVTSVVAQMIEANPALSPMDVKRILVDTAVRLPHVAVDRQGWGVVQPARAVDVARARAGRPTAATT